MSVVVCAWCSPGVVSVGGHGICEAHAAQLDREAEALFAPAKSSEKTVVPAAPRVARPPVERPRPSWFSRSLFPRVRR